MNSYPLQVDQVVWRIRTWINRSRNRKDLEGKQRLALNMYVQFGEEALNITKQRRARLAPKLVPKFGLQIYALFEIREQSQNLLAESGL